MEAKIEEVLDKFDFDQAKTLMEQFGWTIKVKVPGKTYLRDKYPTYNLIRRAAKQLLTDVVAGESTEWAEKYGLRASMDDESLSLSFVAFETVVSLPQG